MMHRIKKKNDLNHDKWIGVGGGFEEGESPFDCVVRETFVETGISLDKPEYRGLVTFVMRVGGELCTEHMHLFTCRDFSGELAADCSEGVLEWVPKDKVEDLPIWEGDKVFLRLLREEQRFFTVKLEYDRDILTGWSTAIGGQM